jgi:dTDP-glucose 4,6-dehydratase
MEQIMRSLNNILITGGAGFIGSNFIRCLFTDVKDFNGCIINLDALTYAGNIKNLTDINEQFGGKRYFFEQGNIADYHFVDAVFKKYKIDTVVHFAAESHVDRSILGPRTFIETNILGTQTLLDVARNYWKNKDDSMQNGTLFHHISTDEVYGSLGETGYFTEETAYDPRSPYSASKAASDHLVMAYHHTYNIPVTLSNCSNNYGPWQFPEKLIPLMILNMLEGKQLPVYGDGKNIRDWIHVQDHNQAIYCILRNGIVGSKYNIGGENEWENIKLLYILIDIIVEKTKCDKNALIKNINYIKDRPGHDRRYAIDCSKIKNELNWRCKINFKTGLEQTVDWYLAHNQWVDDIKKSCKR